jgi:creatinine amidohydrolase
MSRPFIHYTARCAVPSVALLMMASSPVWATETQIERMTSPEVAQRIAGGTTTIIIPTGGTEQNGAHMVLGKHNFIIAETARRIATELSDALVAPVMSYVPEGAIGAGHMAYAGTITVPDRVFEAVLESAAAGFKSNGFKTIVLLGDSGPNQAPQSTVASKLNTAWAGEGVTVVAASTYYAANGGEAYLKSEGETDATIGKHAGIRDTSELMAVYPDGVRLEGALPDSAGISGDPRRASVERGQKLLTLKVAAAVTEIRAKRTAGSDTKTATRAAETPGLLTRLYRSLFD